MPSSSQRADISHDPHKVALMFVLEPTPAYDTGHPLFLMPCTHTWLRSNSSLTTAKRRVPSRSFAISWSHAAWLERRPMPSIARSLPTCHVREWRQHVSAFRRGCDSRASARPLHLCHMCICVCVCAYGDSMRVLMGPDRAYLEGTVHMPCAYVLAAICACIPFTGFQPAFGQCPARTSFWYKPGWSEQHPTPQPMLHSEAGFNTKRGTS